ncbi:hypothetical protein [Nocardia barduliensis]|uniref:hypothetical protein n=1 Tax=Nocardia barduliensis TaxID=2736643 RepID=UPI0015725FD8|nr:hypothetical protein [Nocardia barduliensis]
MEEFLINRTEATTPMPGQARKLTDRATRAGYHLTRDPVPPHNWKRMDAETGDVIVSARA